MNTDFKQLSKLIIICELFAKKEQGGNASIKEIREATGLAPSTVRERVRELLSQGLVAINSEGEYTLTSLSEEKSVPGNGDRAAREASYLWQNLNNQGDTPLIKNCSYDVGCKFFRSSQYLVLSTLVNKEVIGAKDIIESILKCSGNSLDKIVENSVNRTFKALRKVGFTCMYNKPTHKGIQQLNLVDSFIKERIGGIVPPPSLSSSSIRTN